MMGTKRLPIGDLCNLVNGRAFKPADWTDEGLPIVRIQNLNDPAKPFNRFSGEVKDKFLISSGDILLSWSGTPGTSFGCFIWNRGDAILNQHIFRVEVDESKIDRDFFVYAVNSKLEEMIELAHGGVGLRHITKGKLEGIELPVPERDEQRRTVEWLRECLVRADEVEQLVAGVAADARGLEGALFHDFVQEGQVSGNWPTVELAELTTSSKYGTSSKASKAQIGVPVLRMGNIVDGYLDYSDLKYIKLAEAEKAKYLLRPGDILVNRTNSLELVGKAATFNRSDGEWVYASYLVRLRVDQEQVLPEYITAVINSRFGREYVLKTARRAIGMVNINAKEIGRFPIPVPPIDAQIAFLSRLGDARTAAQKLRACNPIGDVAYLRAAIFRRAFEEVDGEAAVA